MFNENDLLPLSALNHLLFCERRAAFIHVEQIWIDNQFTAEGAYAHRKVDQNANLKRGDKRNVNGMMLASYPLGVTVKADLVEFRSERPSADVSSALLPRNEDCKASAGDEREEMNSKDVTHKAQADGTSALPGAQASRPHSCLIPFFLSISNVAKKHRREVNFDEHLRQQTITAAARLHEIVRTGITPPVEWKARCKGCSLLETCMPKAWRPKATAKRYLENLLESEDA